MPVPNAAVVKALFALSHNKCAFPGCDQPMAVLSPEPTIVGEICHIRGKRPGAKRYDSQQTDAARHSFENLILLCGTHHTIIDGDEATYSVERLLEMKAERERDPSDQLVLSDDVIRHWVLLEQEPSFKFGRGFEIYEAEVEITRRDAKNVIERPDASQLFMTDESGLQHAYWLRWGPPFNLLVYTTRRDTPITIEWAIRTKPDIISRQHSPLDLLERVCNLFGNRVTISDQTSKFFRRLALPRLPGERVPPAPRVEPDIWGNKHGSMAWARRVHPVPHWEIRSLHSLSLRRLRMEHGAA
jgi:hypothetical protein